MTERPRSAWRRVLGDVVLILAVLAGLFALLGVWLGYWTSAAIDAAFCLTLAAFWALLR